MFVIHGTYAPQRKRGLAADVCPRCEEVRRFLIADHFLVPHIYFIPLGNGTYRGTSRECQRCRLKLDCRPAHYERVLPAREVEGLTEEQFVVLTNPGLALPEPQRSQWVQAVSELTMFGGASQGETLPQLALSRLLNASLPPGKLEPLAARLGEWSEASLTERLALLTEIATAVGGGREMRTALYFTQAAVKDAPNGAGCLLAMPLGFLLGATWIGGMVWLLPLFDGGLRIAVFVVLASAAVASGIALLEWCARRTYRSWFRKHIIAPAEQNGIDLALVLRIFREMKPTQQTPDNVKALLGKRKVLEQLVQEHHPLAVPD